MYGVELLPAVKQQVCDPRGRRARKAHQLMAAPRRSEAGFTLVELMISLVIFSFVIAGILSVAVAMTQGMREQRQAVLAESAVRVPMDFLVDALRQASPGVSLTANI